jgi:hypothetical protein
VGRLQQRASSEVVGSGGESGGDLWGLGPEVERLPEEVPHHHTRTQQEDQIGQAQAAVTTGQLDEFTVHGQVRLFRSYRPTPTWESSAVPRAGQEEIPGKPWICFNKGGEEG